MMKKANGAIIKFESSAKQTVGEITKTVGLVRAKYMVHIIDSLNLEANPRSSKTGAITQAIQESIESDPMLFPFKTKGVLLAASQYRTLDRGRIEIIPDDIQIEGILDGGHNTLAIGLYILKNSMEYSKRNLPKGQKTWDKFKKLWQENREFVDLYLKNIRKDPSIQDLNFYVPVELLVPRDANSELSVESFKNNLLEICDARNNNVQLPVTAKTNKLGYFVDLKKLFDKKNPELGRRIEWKPSAGGDIKAQDIIALAWIPLTLISPVKDSDGRVIEPISPNSLYNAKGTCLKQFEKLMSSPDVTMATSADYERELYNSEVYSAFEIAVQLPSLYDYIYENFPKLYNAAGGSYGRIMAVKKLNEKRKNKTAPFLHYDIETLSPDGFIIPLFYGLQAIMDKVPAKDGKYIIKWKQEPMPFLKKYLRKIVANYADILSTCDYDPQKVGKSQLSYKNAISGFKMALADIL